MKSGIRKLVLSAVFAALCIGWSLCGMAGAEEECETVSDPNATVMAE